MKMQLNIQLLALIPALVGINSAFAADTYLGDASSLKFKLYGVYLYEDPQCRGTPVTLFEDLSNPQVVDFLTAPTIGNGTANPATFNCIGIRLSSYITAIPGFTSAPCTAGTPVTINLYSPTSCAACNSQNLDGSIGASPSTSEQSIIMYLSTASTNDNPSQLFMKPTSSSDNTHGQRLANPFVVSNSRVGTFVTKNLKYLGYYGAAPGTCDSIAGSAGTPAPIFDFQ